MRDKIVGALRKYVLPRIQFVYPTKTEPASAPPAAVVPQSSAPVVNAAPVSSEAVPPPSVPTPATAPTTKPGTGLAAASKSTMPRASSSATPSELKPPHLLHRVEPVNPPNLKEEGAVVMNATVLQDGSIGKVTVVSGEPALRGAAIAAVKQWRYRPAYQNGQPVAVTVDVEVSFKQ
jgi:protein TonB